MKNRKSELLVILQEEAAEVIQAVSKSIRFGDNERNTKDITNEIGDFLGVLKLLIEDGHFDPLKLEEAGNAKIQKLEQYMTYKKV